MHETGVMAAVLPEWSGIECLVVRDFYHRYTVDEHTLVAIRSLEELRGQDDPLRQRFAALLEEVENRALLVTALLLHDTGKAARTGKHVDASVRLAQGAMERLGAPEELREAVCFLIERHLDFSAILNTRDLDEPATAKYLATRVGTEERLKELALLTYADISAVNPRAMTPWRLEQLWRLYHLTYIELTHELDSERIEATPEVSPEMAAFLAGFPARYLRVHSEEEVQAHFELYGRALQFQAAVDVRKRNGTYTLWVATRDRPFLLASIAGVLAGFGMNILKAEAFSNRRGMILDTFVFEDPKRTLDLNPTEVDRLRITLERVILGRADAKYLLQNRPKLAPLTHAISSAGCNIEIVLIETEAHRALDVFYVTAEGKKLTDAQQISLKENLFKVCVSPAQ
jgi:[protein-PII] uridylyltransferase